MATEGGSEESGNGVKMACRTSLDTLRLNFGGNLLECRAVARVHDKRIEKARICATLLAIGMCEDDVTELKEKAGVGGR